MLNSYAPREAVEDHFNSQNYDDRAKDEAQGLGAGVDEDAGAEHGTGESSEDDRHGDAGIDVTASEIDSRAGGGGDADHEITGGSRNLEGDAHRLIHGQNLDGSRADAKQTGERARTEHEAEAKRDAVDCVMLFALAGGIGAIEMQKAGERVLWIIYGVSGLWTDGEVGGVNEDEAEDDGDG